jgi:UDP-N-acetylmuramate: L-alanyl-gamma-D-glutamyl-meso-diaminopimelate ligase
LAGAKWICQNMVDEADFYEAIASFKGLKTIGKLLKVKNKVAYKDFAHSKQSGCNYKSGERTIS